MENPNLKRAIEVIGKLRDPEDGCPWDLEQTHQSLLPFLIEESYEFCHAVEQNDPKKMAEELGDVLLQVILHSKLASETGDFDIEKVAKILADKMIKRHPHVFQKDFSVKDSAEVKENWKKIKEEEGNGPQYTIGEKYLHAPSLKSSEKIGQKTKELNFDWDDASQVVYKVEEEWQELKEEIVPGVRVNQDAIREELGDFLFSIAQLARHIGIDPEQCLRDSNKKFIRRFNAVEDKIRSQGKSFKDFDQRELDHYWNQVKKEEKGN